MRQACSARCRARRITAERTFRVEGDVLIFDAEDQINQRPAVNHVIDPAAGIPPVLNAQQARR
jgi:hypothetical protein